MSKVTGPLEKLLTMAAVLGFRMANGALSPGRTRLQFSRTFQKLLPVYSGLNRLLAAIIRADAKIMPWCLSSIILVHCRKDALPRKSLD
jgi:hypothetical protein